MRRTLQWSALALASVLAGCGGSGYSTSPSNQPSNNPPTNNPPSGTNVNVRNNSFSPGTLNLTAGQTATWTWDSCSNDPYGGGNTCISHDIVFDDGTTSGSKSEGSYNRTFNAKGTFPYHCSIHGTAMSGTVVVQ